MAERVELEPSYAGLFMILLVEKEGRSKRSDERWVLTNATFSF
jgi:hypothetical protein